MGVKWELDGCQVQMTEEERRDVRKRTLARMKQLSLENLVDFTDEAAK
jgi:hypothetical protein